MTPEFRKKLKALMIDDEGLKTRPYEDTVGKLTIGIGRNLTDRGISADEAFMMYDDDVMYFIGKLNHFDYFTKLNDARQIVIINICFNVGFQGYLEFKKLISALERHDYIEASKEILDSDAARKLNKRYERLASIMLSGEYNV